MPMLRSAALAAAILVPALADASCFTMVDGRNRIVYQSTTSPVNISGSIGDAMARRFPGRSLIISANNGCTGIDEVTNQRTASASAILDARRTSDADYAGTSPTPAQSSAPSPVSSDGTIYDGPPLGRVYGGTVPSNVVPTAPVTATPAPAASARSAPR